MPRARLGGSSGVSSTTETDSAGSTDSESSMSEQRETGSVSTASTDGGYARVGEGGETQETTDPDDVGGGGGEDTDSDSTGDETGSGDATGGGGADTTPDRDPGGAGGGLPRVGEGGETTETTDPDTVGDVTDEPVDTGPARDATGEADRGGLDDELREPGGGPGGYARVGDGPAETTDPDTVEPAPQRDQFDDPKRYVREATEYQFESVPDEEISTTQTGDRVEPRFSEQGARQAVASLLDGVNPESVTLGAAGPAGYSVSDIVDAAEARADAAQTDAQQLADVREQTVEQAREVEAFEAAQEAEQRTDRFRQRFRLGYYGDPEDVISEQVAERKSQEYGFDVQPSDITVERTKDGFDVGIDSEIAQAGEMAQEAESTLGGDIEVTRTGETDFDVEVSQGFGVDDDLESGLESDLDQVVDEPEAPETGEQFGDIDWSFGLGGPGDEVEQFVDQGGELSQDITGGARNIAGGFGAGAASIATAPLRIPGTTLEAVETGAYVAGGDSSDRAVEVIGEANQRIGRATSYYLQNPVEGGTVLAGSLLASYGAMAGAARFGGPRTAAATRYAIQPGEEIAKTAARSGLISPDTATAVPGVRDRTAAPEQAFGRARDTATEWFDTARDRVPARSDLTNRIRREIQRYRYQRPPERDALRIDLADEDDVDAVYIQDLRPDADDADADPLGEVETDVDGDATNVGSMGTTFDGPAVEVDAGGGQRVLFRTRQETRAETEARLRADTETNARSEAELRGRVEPSVPTEATSEVAERALGEGVEPIGRVQLGTETETGVDLLREAQAREVGAETETAVTAEPVFDTATEVGLRSEQTGRVQGAREAVRETETEVELLGEPRSEAPTEAESDPGPDDDAGGETDDNQFGFGATDARENVPGAGWFNVFATALAGGGIEARSDPENIDALAEDDLGVNLPTQGQVDPSEDLAEGYEAVESLFFLDDGDGGGTGASEEADDWGWF